MPSNRVKPFVGRYDAEDMRAIWDFCQQDFERFLDCLGWLETLPDEDRREQLKSARYIRADRRIPRGETIGRTPKWREDLGNL